MTRFYFVRHGDAYNVDTGLQLENYPLNNYGKVQALQLAKRLKENKFDAMYCSKIRRSIETCEIVNEDHNMNVIYMPELNEVGNEDWPQPGVITKSTALEEFSDTVDLVNDVYLELCKKHKDDSDVIVFGHGNWIRVLLSKILGKGDPETFVHFVIHNTALTIIDVDEEGFPFIITVSDAAHTHLFETKI